MWTDIQTNKLTYGRTDDRANRHTDEWTDIKTDRWLDVWIEIDRKAEFFKHPGLRITSK
jgi:hypothetical protein